ncbi:hypothetical protein [Parasporobacterium paucivorans]|nr:hypothetical protein [Parasporobacterium paucivorans]
MSALEKTAYLQNRNDEKPNQELAKELIETNDIDGIREIAKNMFNNDKNIQSDCIKVLYEAGYIKPEMIAEYAGDFIELLRSRNNRMVWGAMLALSTIASIKADEIYKNLEIVLGVMKEGSVIAVDNAVKVLAALASQNDKYNDKIFPFLLDHLRNCRPKEVAQHAESTFQAVNQKNQDEFIKVLMEREGSLTNAQLSRIIKLYKKLHINH